MEQTLRRAGQNPQLPVSLLLRNSHRRCCGQCSVNKLTKFVVLWCGGGVRILIVMPETFV